MFVATNAPGRSAFNRVERRMAPLSHELAGLVLPYDFYGSHLNESGETIDPELETKNFEFAGNTLAEVWSKLVIDDFPVHAIYVTPPVENDEAEDIKEAEEIDIEWRTNHVRESQYCLQIVKCDDPECCSPFRSSLRKVLKDRFLPPPLKLYQNADGLLKCADSDHADAKFLDLSARLAINIEPENTGFTTMPYDYFCPSVNAVLADRTCPKCGIYFASKKSKNTHNKVIHKKENCKRDLIENVKARPFRVAAKRARELLCIWNEDHQDADWMSESEIDTDNLEVDFTSKIYQPIILIEKLEDWLISPWEKNAQF